MAAATSPLYEVLALRYARHEGRVARENFLHADDHDLNMPIDYYVWAIRGPLGANPGRTILVDTGMHEDSAARRPGRVILRTVPAALHDAGIEPEDVRDVVLTHLHFDHAGCLDLFANATFHLQDSEIAYATGRAMSHTVLRWPFELEDVCATVGKVYAGRVRFHDAAAEIAPGITVHLVGGHSGGLQVVRVPTERGWIVLASDACHLWSNIRERNPFPIVVDLPRMLEGYRIVEELADGPDHVIPGHDPLVRARFPGLDGSSDTVRLDLSPTS